MRYEITASVTSRVDYIVETDLDPWDFDPDDSKYDILSESPRSSSHVVVEEVTLEGVDSEQGEYEEVRLDELPEWLQEAIRDELDR